MDNRYTEGDFTYRLLPDGTAEITKWNGSDKTLDVPSQLNGYPVTSIGDGAFYDCKSLTSVNIPKGVTSIGKYAFYGCKSLTSIALPDSITHIGGNPFVSCAKLTTITVSQNHPYLYTVDGVLFSRPDSRLICYPAILSDAKYAVPQGVTSIGDGAFCDCKSLTSITLPESVTSIGEMAFSACPSLTSVNIPKGVTSIGDSVFSGCSSLTSVNIPEGVTSIGDSVFSGCSSLTSVNIPEGVTSIGDWAFFGCPSLTSVNIPKGTTSIGDNAFSNCNSLTSVNIPESVTSIGDSAFSFCDSLTSVTIPEGVTSIRKQAFYGCKSLTTINIPEGAKFIGVYEHERGPCHTAPLWDPSEIVRQVFDGCPKSTINTIYSQLRSNAGLPDIPYTGTSYSDARRKGIPSNGSRSGFRGIFLLLFLLLLFLLYISLPQKSTFDSSNSLTVTGTSYSDVHISTEGDFICTLLPDGTAEITNWKGSDLTLDLDVPSQLNGYPVTSIRSLAFTNCLLLRSITIPESVTSIGDFAFSGHHTLTSVTIPESVTSIGESAFFGCYSLTLIVTPDSYAHSYAKQEGIAYRFN